MRQGELRRVVVVGCSCSGKTMLAKALAARIAGDHIELDSINNLAGWQERDRQETRQMVATRVQAPRWVVDGNYGWLAEDIRPFADTMIILDLPLRTVFRRAVVRTFRRVAFRQELWNGNRETWANLLSLDPAQSIIVWTWQRHPVYRRKYRALLAQHRRNETQLVHLTSARSVRRFLRTVKAG